MKKYVHQPGGEMYARQHISGRSNNNTEYKEKREKKDATRIIAAVEGERKTGTSRTGILLWLSE